MALRVLSFLFSKPLLLSGRDWGRMPLPGRSPVTAKPQGSACEAQTTTYPEPWEHAGTAKHDKVEGQRLNGRAKTPVTAELCLPRVTLLGPGEAGMFYQPDIRTWR